MLQWSQQNHINRKKQDAFLRFPKQTPSLPQLQNLRQGENQVESNTDWKRAWLCGKDTDNTLTPVVKGPDGP